MSSGLAGRIRSATESEQFDLSGYTEDRVTELVQDAFSAPLTSAKEMIRLTFVVGGGKLVRARYPEELSKWMVTGMHLDAIEIIVRNNIFSLVHSPARESWLRGGQICCRDTGLTRNL